MNRHQLSAARFNVMKLHLEETVQIFLTDEVSVAVRSKGDIIVMKLHVGKQIREKRRLVDQEK